MYLAKKTNLQIHKMLINTGDKDELQEKRKKTYLQLKINCRQVLYKENEWISFHFKIWDAIFVKFCCTFFLPSFFLVFNNIK